MFLRFVASVLLGFCLCVPPSLFAQGAAADEQPAGNALIQAEAVSNAEVAANVEVSAEAPKDDKTPQWVWGEVVSVDQANKQVVIKHLDYETYEEVQTTLKSDEKTIFENIAGLSDIRPKDHITVDYNIKDNVNVAELVVVDKEQTMATDETEPVVEAAADQAAQATPPVPAPAEQ